MPLLINSLTIGTLLAGVITVSFAHSKYYLQPTTAGEIGSDPVQQIVTWSWEEVS